MKFCHQCGKQVPDNAKFCGFCGYKFETVQTQQSVSQPVIMPPPNVSQTNQFVSSQQQNPLSKFLSEEQDPQAVQRAFSKVSQILTKGEEISYIAVQKGLNISPDCAVLTNRRFIIYRPTILGSANFSDYIWRDLQDAKLNEGMVWSSLTFHTIKGQIITINDLPKSQARKLYSFAQEMEESVLEERRLRAMEEKRAAAGGIVFQGPVPSMSPSYPVNQKQQEDPLVLLKKLKDMQDAGLITSQEFESKKADILSRM